MKKRTAAIFLFNGFADWEPALLTALLNAHTDFTIKTFSADGESVKSMGGMIVQPDYYIDQVNIPKTELLLLPGGDAWETNSNNAVIPLVKEAFGYSTLVAAICAATILPAKMGILNHTRHTSNAPEFLKYHCAAYQGEALYEHRPCVHDGQLITANGAGFIEMTFAILKAVTEMPAQELDNLEELYKSGGMVNKVFV